MTLEDLATLEDRIKSETIDNNEILLIIIDLYKSSSKHFKEIKSKLDNQNNQIKKIESELEKLNKLSSISYMAELNIEHDED